MFSKVVVLSAFVAVVLAAASLHEPVPIVHQDSDIQPDGAFQWSFEAGDGTSQEQHGVPKPVDKGEIAEQVQGSASWTDPEGGKHQLTYTADENGFQPQGADLPVAPEIPVLIARGLAYNAAHPELPQH